MIFFNVVLSCLCCLLRAQQLLGTSVTVSRQIWQSRRHNLFTETVMNRGRGLASHCQIFVQQYFCLLVYMCIYVYIHMCEYEHDYKNNCSLAMRLLLNIHLTESGLILPRLVPNHPKNVCSDFICKFTFLPLPPSLCLSPSQLLCLPPLLLSVFHQLAPRWSGQDNPLSRMSSLLSALWMYDAHHKQKTTTRIPL